MDVLQKSSRGIAIARYCIHHLAEVRAPDMAAAKILGLVVTPTTQSLAIREGSEWGSTPEIFARERSSNQMDVPLAPTSLRLISVQL